MYEHFEQSRSFHNALATWLLVPLAQLVGVPAAVFAYLQPGRHATYLILLVPFVLTLVMLGASLVMDARGDPGAFRLVGFRWLQAGMYAITAGVVIAKFL
ncbi:hypothetical protein ACQQ2N_13805 [Dokdonella sp. MW10]|uniref:hypothetical protein n=1 Tax=Dokdonella sp. MW10 TaxID=2992926 RepID=UPI003F7D394E